MGKSMKDILKAYSFKEKIAMLLKSSRKNDYVIELRGYGAFLPLRNEALAGKLNIISSLWLNEMKEFLYGGKPDITKEGTFDELVSTSFDLRTFEIVVKMQDEGILGGGDDRCKWKIKGGLGLFKRLLADQVDLQLMQMMNRAYEEELAEEKRLAMERICAKMHAEAQKVDEISHVNVLAS